MDMNDLPGFEVDDDETPTMTEEEVAAICAAWDANADADLAASERAATEGRN